MPNGTTERSGKAGDKTTTGRLTRVETVVESLAHDVGELVKRSERTDAKIERLAGLMAERAERAGRPDWRAIAAWAAVLVGCCSVLAALIVPAITMVAVVGSREIDRVRSEHANDVSDIRGTQAAREPYILELKQLQTEVQKSRAHIETQIYSLSARVNVNRDEAIRNDQILANKLGAYIPPPTYYPPVFGSDKP